MKWYKKQLDAVLKKSASKKKTAKKSTTAAVKKTTAATPRQTKQAFAKGVNSMFQRNKNRPKTDLY